MLVRTLSLYRHAYSGLSRSTWLLSFVMLVNRSGTMVIPFMSIYLTQPKMGYSIGQAGIVMGLFGLGAVCGGLIGGSLTDKWGFYPVQMITLTGGGILFMVLGQMQRFPLICLFTFLLSVVNDAFRPANSTAIAHYSKEENRTRSYSLNRLAINLGWAFGGAIGGILASISYHLLFWVDGCTNLVAVLLLRYLLSPANNEASHPKKAAIPAPVRSAYRDRSYLVFIGLTILFGLCFFQLFTTITVYYKKVLGLPEYLIGLIMAVNGCLIALFEMVLVFKLEGKRENLFYISYGMLVVGCSFLLMNLMPPLALTAFVFTILVTVGEISSMPFMNSFWVSRTTSANRGQYAGLYTIAWSTAQVLGPTVGSQIVEHFSFRVLWWIMGGLCILAAGGFKWLQKNKRPPA